MKTLTLTDEEFELLELISSMLYDHKEEYFNSESPLQTLFNTIDKIAPSALTPALRNKFKDYQEEVEQGKKQRIRAIETLKTKIDMVKVQTN